MISIELLYALVQSLHKSEKRYFRLFSSLQQGDKGYLRLFDYLDHHVPSGTPILQELAALFPGHSLEPARKHLYRVIMKSLRQFDSERSVEVKLSTMLHDSRILVNKGFPDQALAVLTRAKKIAFSKERFLFHILLTRQELKILAGRQFAGMDESDLIATQQTTKELLEHEARLHQHASLYEILLLRYWKSGTVRSAIENARLNDLLLEEHYILTNQQLTTFESRQLHLHFQSVYMLMTGNPEGSLAAFYELDQLFQNNTALWMDTPNDYLQFLNGILQTLRRMERFADMPYFIERSRAVRVPSESLSLLVMYQGLELEIYSEIQQQNYQQASGLILSLFEEKPQREISQLPFSLQARISLTIARFYLITQDYPKALRTANAILNQASGSLSRSLATCYRLLNLMIHTALDNTDLLHYEIRTSERAFKKSKSWFKTEQLVLQLLKDYLRHRPLTNYEPKFAGLSQDPFERELIVELGLTNWVAQLQRNRVFN